MSYEDAIKWLENLKQDVSQLRYEDSWSYAQAIDKIMDLLKEQEAVPVIQREIMHMLFWCCGSCGVAITDGDKFCRNCGKQVKWNERNDL